MLSERVRKVKPSATLEITAKAKAMKARGIDVVGFGAGEPDFDTPEHIKEALYKAVEEGFVYYTPPAGIPELKEAISKKYLRENQVDYDPGSEVIVTVGAKHALYEAILSTVNPGEEVLIPDPFWVSYEPMVEMAGGKPIFVPTEEENDFQLKHEEIEARITPNTKALIVNSPSNPTGAVIERKELKAIASVCAEHDIIAISDEIYEKIIYGAEHVSLASFPEMKERTITVNGLSKSYSMTGWRLGYACAPAEIISAMSRIQAHSTSNTTSFVQKAGVVALNASQDCVSDMVTEFKKRRERIVAMLREIDGVSCFLPKGAFYVFPNFSSYEEDSLKLTEYLLNEAKVAVIPGSAFGTKGEGFLRLSYATSMENIEEGITRIKKALERLR